MNAQMLEGLAGASANLKLASASMSVYRQASAEGDTEKMKQALGHAGECAAKASKYQKKLEKGMEEQAKAAREEAKLEQDAAMEKRKEEGKSAQDAAGSRPGDRYGSNQRSRKGRAKRLFQRQGNAQRPGRLHRNRQNSRAS